MGYRVGAIGFLFTLFTLFTVVLLQGHVVALQAAEAEGGGQSVTESSKTQASIQLKQKAQKPSSQSVTQSAPATDQAARKKIWNSPEMQKARAWVDDYLRVTNKYTPEQKAEYKKHLASLTAPQMQMWLMRFEHDQSAAKKRESGFQAARDAQLAQAQAAIKQNQKSLSDIEKGGNTAAADEEKRLKSEQTFARSMYRQKQRESSQMLEEYSSGGFGWGFGMGMR